MSEFTTTHPFLRMYLDYVENTESPRIFHVWSALSCVSAALGRRCWLPTDLGPTWPNMYVALTGPPATRKGAAIKMACDLLRATTKIKFSPNDTGGQRQGLISAMLETGNEDEEQELLEAIGQVQDTKTTLNALSTVEVGLAQLAGIDFDTRDPHTMFAVANELNSLIGENNTAMMTFLQEMWDGVPYKYKLAKMTQTLEAGLLNILAGTTPQQISISMPAEAMGQGFTSRVVFVYADSNFKRVARPTLRKELLPQLHMIYSEIYNRMDGEFTETLAAAEKWDELYHRGISLNDTRFLHYCDRRGPHLSKLSMALAASRGTKIIDLIDVEVADKILLLTEQRMPDAFGEYGMTKVSQARARLLDYLRKATGPVPVMALFGLMQRDMSHIEFKTAMTDMHASKKITLTTLPDLGQCAIATDTSAARKAKRELTDIETMLKVG